MAYSFTYNVTGVVLFTQMIMLPEEQCPPKNK